MDVTINIYDSKCLQNISNQIDTGFVKYSNSIYNNVGCVIVSNSINQSIALPLRIITTNIPINQITYYLTLYQNSPNQLYYNNFIII